ncbi:MAG: ArsJ-associated glyceraldehyde-3-phosphate dehydrogenase [Myxococcales bacterium FL481]|nr:MAG: ArsJ-associated glyceraldehyde-3-phosphate dehydrogenase [Myxococcales bacterium FL481]
MNARVAINGFGRMGRLALRSVCTRPDLSIVHVNEVAATAETSAYLLEHDSIHGRWSTSVSSEADQLLVGDARIGYGQAAAPADVPWGELGVDIVFECTGKFRTAESLAPYFERGVKKVIVSAPVKSGALNVVMGINHHLYDPRQHDIVTAASCTTNCLAPVVKVVHEQFGIRHGVITTIHDVTNTQRIVDAPHADPRRARSALMSLIPTTTGSATAIAMIYPELAGKLNGLAVRVPVLNASLTDCVFEVERETTVAEVNAAFLAAAEGELRGILGYETKPLVSVDYRDDPRSSVIDALSTMVVDKTQIKVLAWYDSEFGYVERMVELCGLVARSLN